MKKILAAATLILTHCAPASADDASACYAIHNPDRRAYCIATTRNDVGMCYAIQSAELRAQCLARVR